MFILAFQGLVFFSKTLQYITARCDVNGNINRVTLAKALQYITARCDVNSNVLNKEYQNKMVCSFVYKYERSCSNFE